MNTEERVAMHRRMAESYRDAYLHQGEKVKDGAKYEAWVFADDAIYQSRYFTGDEAMPMGNFTKDRSVSVATFATMEAVSYSVNFTDWGMVEFKCWPGDNGFVMRSRFVGHAKNGTKYSFSSMGLVETNDKGQIKHWETFVDGEEFGPFLEAAIGVRGPFHGATAYFEALLGFLGEHDLLDKVGLPGM